MKNQKTASEQYKARRTQIDMLIEKLQLDLETLDQQQAQRPRDWGFAGTAAQVVENVAQAAAGIGAITPEQYTELTGEEY